MKNSCPACSSGKTKIVEHQIKECLHCGAIFGSCYLGDSYKYVKPFMTSVESDNVKYFDFDCLGSEGLVRRHGWFDVNSGLITQVG